MHFLSVKGKMVKCVLFDAVLAAVLAGSFL